MQESHADAVSSNGLDPVSTALEKVVNRHDTMIHQDDCLGSDDTDGDGAFSICFAERDFKEPFEGRPEVYVVVYGPEKKKLRRTKPERLAKGQTEISFHVVIDAGFLVTDPRISRRLSESFYRSPTRPADSVGRVRVGYAPSVSGAIREGAEPRARRR